MHSLQEKTLFMMQIWEWNLKMQNLGKKGAKNGKLDKKEIENVKLL